MAMTYDLEGRCHILPPVVNYIAAQVKINSLQRNFVRYHDLGTIIMCKYKSKR